ncbi:homeobox-containing protein 1 isoform X5 [Pseudoliparis swirei]|uniref:homeobox-containing protein 1 isoform X5 n=1 Tax=Pseudoliparis swirei TaxID=2059687 RepID=UPI0024BE9D86|nr:homeobox-containing protein 1 isoform X5 [Pseudoliparis swirei]
MRQWCVPAATPRAEPLPPGRLSVSPPPSDARMEFCEAEPRYTLEQIDLLQRLRLSGMTKPQILHALESLERLDPDHRPPHGDSQPAPSNSNNNINNAANNNINNATPAAAAAPAPSSSSSSSSSLSLASATTQTSGLDGAALSPSNSYEASPPPLYPPSAAAQRSFSYDMMADEEWDLEEKVAEYMRRDSNLVKEEIKTFLNNRRISQAIVGQVTGISQSYISQWLLQQGLEMSDSKRRAFYRWYLLERNNPGATLSMRSLVKEEPDWRTGVMAADRAGLVGGPLRLRRGSRFTWRKECQSIMESFFMENQYPDEAKREEIANACNSVIQKPGCKLSEFERVTALKVYNWFANRRKEMKRRANIAAILESHGIEVPSPSCHSNGEEGEMPEFADQVTHRFSEQEDASSHRTAEQQDPSLLLATTEAAAAPPSPAPPPQGLDRKEEAEEEEEEEDPKRETVDEE